MNNEECIEWLISIQKKYIHGGDEEFDRKRKEAIEYAINQLIGVDSPCAVERSKYDNLHNLAKSWLEEKKELKKANNEFRSKVDKAVERIKHIPLISTRNRVTIYKSGEEILKEVLDILEHIGE